VRKGAIAGKNLPPVDAGEGVGVCIRWFFMCLVVCFLVFGCMIGVLGPVAMHHLGRGIGGLPPRGRQVDNLLCLCDSSLRLL
jgi:hypothetical protein